MRRSFFWHPPKVCYRIPKRWRSQAFRNNCLHYITTLVEIGGGAHETFYGHNNLMRSNLHRKRSGQGLFHITPASSFHAVFEPRAPRQTLLHKDVAIRISSISFSSQLLFGLRSGPIPSISMPALRPVTSQAGSKRKCHNFSVLMFLKWEQPK